MYKHPDDNYQPQHPHLEFEHSEISLKDIGSSILSGAKRVKRAASRAKRAVKDAIILRSFSKKGSKDRKELKKVLKKKAEEEDAEEDGKEEEEAYMSDEEYEPQHPHLQFEHSEAGFFSRKKKFNKKRAIAAVAKTDLVRVWLATYNEMANSKLIKVKGKFKRVMIQGRENAMNDFRDEYQKSEGIAMSNAYFPVICENYLSMKGAKFDRNASGSRGSKKANKKKLAKAIVDTLTKPEYKDGTAGVGSKLPEKYIGAMLANVGYQKIYSPNKKMSGYAKKNVKRPWGKYGKTSDDIEGKRLNTKTLKLVKIISGTKRNPVDYTSLVKQYWKEVYDILDKIE